MLLWNRPEVFLEGRPEQEERSEWARGSRKHVRREKRTPYRRKRGQGSATLRRKDILGEDESLIVEKRRRGGGASIQASTLWPLPELDRCCANLPRHPS